MPRKPASKSTAVVIEDARLAKIAKAFAADRRVSVGRLFASVGLKVDAKIFAMVVKGRLVVKLPKERVDALVASGAAERFDPGHGRVMREWASFGEDGPTWLSLAREARAFVGGS
jgi:TfoX/Sxy family transcriptional regulator of competence genes